jgi:hypothetical protein
MPRKKQDYIGSFEDRCHALALQKRERAAKLPRGTERDALEQEIRQLESATHIHNWLTSTELRAPD